MDEDNKVVAEARETFGKGAARKIRAAGKIPAVLYGHGTDPRHLTLPGHQILLLILKANAVLELQIGSTTELALVKDVQKDPVHQIIEHLDLIVVKRGEKVQVEVPVHVEGEPESGTIADLDATTLSLEVEATHIPENVVVSVEALEDGTKLFASDVELPQGATLLSDPETLVINVHVPQKVDLGEEPEAAEGEEAEEGAEEAEEAASEESAE